MTPRPKDRVVDNREEFRRALHERDACRQACPADPVEPEVARRDAPPPPPPLAAFVMMAAASFATIILLIHIISRVLR